MSAALHSLMRDIPASPPSRVLGELLGFLAVGTTGAAAFVALSSFVVSLDTGYANWLVNAACYAVLIVPIYLLQRRFSFRSSAAHHHALPRYVAVQLLAVVLAAVFSFAIHAVLILPPLLTSVLVIVPTSALSFVVLRHWAFTRRSTKAVTV
ncbi:MAG TPA: GtrA family protein [Devosia sp.]|uniref:GtrA family protein n=1 Tax=Devosia sp. TaxID=1871048 RepID=UPI002F9437FB